MSYVLRPFGYFVGGSHILTIEGVLNLLPEGGGWDAQNLIRSRNDFDRDYQTVLTTFATN